jgi:hypothetical protein
MVVRFLLTACLIAALAAGCSSRPKAPPLTNESAYQNDDVGLRFLVPPGWRMQSRAVLPPGQLTRPVILVSYNGDGEKPAAIQILAADIAADADLERFLAVHQVGPDVWSGQSPAERVTVNGVDASRLVLSRAKGKEEARREVTAFRRGKRTYLFLLDFTASDAVARDAGRAAINSIVWKP